MCVLDENSGGVTEGQIWGTEKEQRVGFVHTRIINFIYDTFNIVFSGAQPRQFV
jgi:hypothetical protein